MMMEAVPIRSRNKDPLVVGDTVFHSSHDWDLTEMELEKARNELGETEDKKRRFLREMRDKLSKEGNYRLDDSFLLRFLRVRKYDCEKAYLNVKNYYNVRKKHPEMFDVPSNFNCLKNHGFDTLLPYGDEEGRILFWMDLGCWNPLEESFTEIMQLANAVDDMVTMNPKCQVNGIIGIWDCKELSARKLAEVLRRNQLMAVFSLLIFSTPWRIKKLIVLNTSRLARIVYNLARPLLTKKLSERVFLLSSDLNELHQHVNPAILPKKLGGDLEDDACRNPKFLLDNTPYLEYERSFTGAWEGK